MVNIYVKEAGGKYIRNVRAMDFQNIFARDCSCIDGGHSDALFLSIFLIEN